VVRAVEGPEDRGVREPMPPVRPSRTRASRPRRRAPPGRTRRRSRVRSHRPLRRRRGT
jgi:hypothetical protein